MPETLGADWSFAQCTECEKPVRARGLCNAHYLRQRRYGRLHRAKVVRTYDSAHCNLRRARGPASQFTCACGKPAEQWAYDHEDIEERTVDGRTFSLKHEHYVAMCITCHHQFDGIHEKVMA